MVSNVNKSSSLFLIFSEFLARYPKQFIALFLLLVVEGMAAAISVLAIVPMADYMIDSALKNPSKVTEVTVNLLGLIGLVPSFWIFGILFVVSSLIKGILEVSIRYAILKIKYGVVSGLFGDAFKAFFKARWEFFSGTDQGRLLNTLGKELNTIGDTFGYLATLLAQIVQLSIFLIMPILISAKLTLTALGLSVLFALPFMLLYQVSYRLGQRNTESANNALGILSEVMTAARLILGFGRQSQSRDRFIKSFDQHTAITLRSQTLSTAIPKLFQPMAMLAVVVAIGFALEDGIPISELAAVMWSLLGALPIFAALLQGNIAIRNFIPSYEQLISLRKEHPS